ncbi:C-type lectin domain family 4 member E isoform X2 [Choloepus didactylus]|uniref:C-type lectin domain family 4 member E isoform X2 n=1 Tax=Choloepus didactylus TaxID=27675 RepID=UPI00189F5BC1|nr:C-type lectin domain family 4 member E isoform X2 [Choloepus didactylus]
MFLFPSVLMDSGWNSHPTSQCLFYHQMCWWVLKIKFNLNLPVTHHIFQLCDKEKFQPEENLMSLSCCNNGSGSVQNCPLKWEHFQSSCYFFSTDTLTWTSSVKNCSGMGGHLVVINTEEEQKFLFRKKPREREFYIGLTDQVKEGQWQWVDGTPFKESLSFWDAGEPNNLATVEDCATIRDSSNPKQNWNDVTCLFYLFRICEMPARNVLNKEKSLKRESPT